MNNLNKNTINIEEFNTVRTDAGRVSWEENGKIYHLVIDYSHPMTLQRCAELHELIESKLDKKVSHIWMDHSKFNNNEKIFDKSFHYCADENSLKISENGIAIYENNNGTICKDREALADSAWN